MATPPPPRLARTSLAGQLSFLLVVLIALALGVYGWVSHQQRQRVLMAEASAELANHAVMVEAAVIGALERGEVELLKQRLRRFTRADRVLGVACFDADARPILVTDHLAAATADLAAMSRRAQAAPDDLEDSIVLAGVPVLVRAVRIVPPRGTPVVAIVARDTRYVEGLATTLNRGLAVTALALLAATSLLVMLLARATVGKPAAMIVAGAEAIASGDLGTTVPEQGASELARLARAFNAMSRSLGEARQRADEEAERRSEEQVARIRAERRLSHARALAAVGQVAASIAHEVGSPLGVILGRARLLADREDCPEEVRADLETIATQSERISRVVSRLLSLARPPRGLPEVSDVSAVVGELLAFLGPEARQRNITPSFELRGAPLRVMLDADRLFQVLFNLCWNAMEAQPDGGALRIEAVPERRAGGVSGRVAIVVSDEGPGVPPEIAASIFEPFFTTKSDRSGSGLGLDIVSGIVREAGGTIALLPCSGKGASFRVSLPSPELEDARDLRDRTAQEVA